MIQYNLYVGLMGYYRIKKKMWLLIKSISIDGVKIFSF